MLASCKLLLLLSVAFTSKAFKMVPGSRFSSSNAVNISKSALNASSKPLTELCEISKKACDAIAPMLQGIQLFL